jgi:hypothetical protein
MSNLLSTDLNQLDQSIKTGIGNNFHDGAGNPISSTLHGTDRGINVSLNKGSQLDGYGRLRAVSPEIIFGLYFSHGIHPLYFNSSSSGTGTATYNATTGTLDLAVGTASGDSIIYQTRKRIPYSPGDAHTIFATGNIGAKKTNVRKRFGLFDALDGPYWEQTGTDIAVVQRTSSSGSAVNTRVAQANWNLDKLDGTGASGVTLSEANHQGFIIEYVWQGTGTVRMGIILDDGIVYCHRFLNANSLALPYCLTPQLPVRFEMTNTGVSASATTMKMVCATVLKEGGGIASTAPYSFGATRGRTSVTAGTTEIPLISIQPKTTFNGVANRIPIIPRQLDISSASVAVIVRGYLNATLTSPTFNAAPASNSATNFDIAASALTGGSLIYESQVDSSAGGSLDLSCIRGIANLGFDVAGTTGDIFTVTVQSTAGNTATFGGLTWDEYQ